MAHEAGALVLIDGAQAVPHVPVDVQALGADFYAFCGHKMLGPTGSGALWARRELLEAMPPFMAGGEMIREVHLRRSEWNEIPWKFEAGTPDIAARDRPGRRGGVPDGAGHGPRPRARARARRLRPRRARRASTRTSTLYGPLDRRPPRRRHPVQRAGRPPARRRPGAGPLRRRGPRRPPLHDAAPRAPRPRRPRARASFNVYTTEADIDALVAGLPRSSASSAPDAESPRSPAAPGCRSAGARATARRSVAALASHPRHRDRSGSPRRSRATAESRRSSDRRCRDRQLGIGHRDHGPRSCKIAERDVARGRRTPTVTRELAHERLGAVIDPRRGLPPARASRRRRPQAARQLLGVGRSAKSPGTRRLDALVRDPDRFASGQPIATRRVASVARSERAMTWRAMASRAVEARSISAQATPTGDGRSGSIG